MSLLLACWFFWVQIFAGEIIWTPEADDPMPIFASFPTGHTFRHSMSGGTNSAATRCCGVCGCPWNCWRNADGGKGGAGNSWGAAWCGWKPPVVVSWKRCRCSGSVATYPTAKSYLVQYSLLIIYLSYLATSYLSIYEGLLPKKVFLVPKQELFHIFSYNVCLKTERQSPKSSQWIRPKNHPGDVRWRRRSHVTCKGDIRRYDDANDIDIRTVTNMIK